MLSAYEYNLEYRRTQDHANADCLSRLPIPGDRRNIEPPGDVLLLEAVEYPPVSAADVASATLRDPCLSRVTKWVTTGWPEQGVPPEYAAYEMRREELSLHCDCLLWGNRVILPEELREDVLAILHANHPGITAMKALARSYVWWPKIDAQIEEFVRHCKPCQENRQSEPKTPVHFWTKPESPWTRIHIDFAGPVKGVFFLVVVDALSNWAEIEIMPSLHSSAVIEKLRRMFASYGLPELVVSDNGTAFSSNEMQSVEKKWRALHVHSAIPSRKQRKG